METDLQMVWRHVRDGRDHLRRQRALLARLRAGGEAIELAEAVLATMEATQRQHEQHLGRVLAKDDAPLPPGNPGAA